MHDGLAQLNSPRALWMYSWYESGVPATSREGRMRQP